MTDPSGRRGAPVPSVRRVPPAPPPEGHASLTLALWAAAWLGGGVPPDAAISAVSRWAPLHVASAASEEAATRTGLPWPPGPAGGGAGAAAVLAALRALGPDVTLHLVLPVPGDTTGIAPGGRFASAAAGAGEALLVHGPPGRGAACTGCIGLVPEREGHDVIHWTAHDAGCRGQAVPPAAGAARQALRSAVRDAAELLAGTVRVGGAGAGARRAVAARVSLAEEHVLPPGTPQRCAETLHSATTVAAIVSVAADAWAGTPHTARDAEEHERTMRTLSAAVRQARLGAAAEAVSALRAGPGAAGARSSP